MMGYLPSFFQKRVLRYALSRLNIIDADALGLDQLDISWGKKSTFEFRDVGLQLEVSRFPKHGPAEVIWVAELMLTVSI